MKCPHCNTDLEESKESSGFYFKCVSCGGVLGNLSVLRKRSKEAAISQLTGLIRSNRSKTGNVSCSVCGKKMKVLDYFEEKGTRMQIDFCGQCHFIWFDAQELDRIPKKPAGEIPERSPRGGRRTSKTLPVPPFNHNGSVIFDDYDDGFDLVYWILSGWKLGFWAGFIPLMFLFLAYLNWESYDRYTNFLGFHPGQPSLYSGLGIFFSFFIHGGFVHAIVNGFFAIIFIRRCQESLGTLTALGLLFVGQIVGVISDYLTIWEEGAYTYGAGPALTLIASFLIARSPWRSFGFSVDDDDLYVENPKVMNFPILYWGILWFFAQITFLFLGEGNSNAFSIIATALVGMLLSFLSPASKMKKWR